MDGLILVTDADGSTVYFDPAYTASDGNRVEVGPGDDALAGCLTPPEDEPR